MTEHFSSYKIDFVAVFNFFIHADGPAISSFNKMIETLPQERRALFGIGKLDPVSSAILKVTQSVKEVGDKIMTHNEALHDGT